MRFAAWLNPRLRYPTAATLLSLPILLTAGPFSQARAQTSGAASDGGAITLRADVQEANANTGIITARGNVRVDYPSRQIFATSAQAQYFSRERRIILNGSVYVQQEGNTLRAETVTYLIDEGRFVATPQPDEQVESVYILPPSPPPGASGEANGETAADAAPSSLPDLPQPTSLPTELPATDVPTDE
ncbi:MAG: LptA/OstA family protein [Cyanobacteria bacterium P01_G01_bin.38]